MPLCAAPYFLVFLLNIEIYSQLPMKVRIPKEYGKL